VYDDLAASAGAVELFLDSVTGRVVAAAPCPVLTVRAT